MQKKKKQWLKMAGYFLMIPLFLYGSLCLFFYLEKRKDPVLSYRMSFDSDRSPAQFKVNEQGNRVYIDQSGAVDEGAMYPRIRRTKERYEADTEAAACWDCYKGSWSEEFRKALARWLPSGLRMKDHGRAVNCAAGALQATIDIGGGFVLITGGTVAYVLQFLDGDNVELRKHRRSQLDYAFYFVRDGTVFKVMSDGMKKLINHIAKSIKTGDNYALCEMATVFASLSLGKWAGFKMKADKPHFAAKEQNIISKFDNELARLDAAVAKAQREFDFALARSNVMKTGNSTTGTNLGSATGKPSGTSSSQKATIAEARATEANLKNKLTELEKLKAERATHIKQGKKGWWRARAERSITRTALAPLYFLKAIKDEAMFFVPTRAKDIVLQPSLAAGATAVVYSPYIAGRKLKDPNERTVQDYLDSLDLGDLTGP